MSQEIQIVGADFERLQAIQVELLREFDRVCRKHHIPYTIFGGTLLGAVRHQRHIPWDDDADVAMLREDYERFKSITRDLNSDICFFQDHTTDPHYRWGYGKLRHANTIFIRAGQEHIKSRTGVFIDIFPMDDVPKYLVGRMIVDFEFFLARKVLWSEAAKESQANSYLKRTFFRIINLIPANWALFLLDRRAKKSSRNSTKPVRTLLFPSTGKLYNRNPLRLRYGMPKQWITDIQEYPFSELTLYGTRDYDSCLKYIYGDYLRLPPPEQRLPHAPVSYYDFGDVCK